MMYRPPILHRIAGELVRPRGPAADCFRCGERAEPPLVEFHGATGSISLDPGCARELGAGAIADATRASDLGALARSPERRGLRVVGWAR